MRKYLLPTGILAALLSPCATVAAQSADDGSSETVTVIVGEKEAAGEVEITLKENAPKVKREAGLPRFAIVGHDRKFYMGIGAQLNGVAVFDFGDRMPSAIDFIPSSMTRKTAGNGGSLRFSAATSSIYLNVVALPGTDNKIGLFFKGDFTNDGYGFTISHFYATYRGLKAGYTNSLFQDDDAIPYTIDNQGPNGMAATTIMTGSWTQSFGKGFSGAIGIEAPNADMTDGKHAVQVTQRVPAVPLYLQYAYGASNHIRASFLFRPLQYRNELTAKNKTPFGWGVQLSGVTEIVSPLTFYYSGVYGRGIANYLQDTEGLGLDATPVHDTGEMKLVESMGLTAGLGLQISKKWQANVSYSHLSNWTDRDARPSGNSYRYGDYVAANILYDLNRFLTFGLEYDYGHAKDWNNNSLHSNRLQGLVSVTF